MKKAFIDRSPLRIIGGLFILIVGFLAKSSPLIILGFFDLGISFLFFYNPDISDKKSLKFLTLIIYGSILFWSIIWLASKI